MQKTKSRIETEIPSVYIMRYYRHLDCAKNLKREKIALSVCIVTGIISVMLQLLYWVAIIFAFGVVAFGVGIIDTKATGWLSAEYANDAKWTKSLLNTSVGRVLLDLYNESLELKDLLNREVISKQEYSQQLDILEVRMDELWLQAAYEAKLVVDAGSLFAMQDRMLAAAGRYSEEMRVAREELAASSQTNDCANDNVESNSSNGDTSIVNRCMA